MSGYVSTKELRDYDKKTWLTESEANEVERLSSVTPFTQSDLIRIAVRRMIKLVNTEGYAVLLME